jgi:DNA-3-methyladenine glycosylase II
MAHSILRGEGVSGLLREADAIGKLRKVAVGLTAEELRADLDILALRVPQLAQQLGRIGYPEPRLRPRGFMTLLRTIVGQQVSVAAAASMWRKLEAELGTGFTPACLLARDFDTLRACGLSRQKQGYARSLCELVATGEVDFEALPGDDEEAIAMLTRINGIGRWSAEIYLLFAEGRRDIWPAGDLAVQEGIKRLLDLPERPAEKAARSLAEPWAPQRGAMAIFTWHFYANPAL